MLKRKYGKWKLNMLFVSSCFEQQLLKHLITYTEGFKFNSKYLIWFSRNLMVYIIRHGMIKIWIIRRDKKSTFEVYIAGNSIHILTTTGGICKAKTHRTFLKQAKMTWLTLIMWFTMAFISSTRTNRCAIAWFSWS